MTLSVPKGVRVWVTRDGTPGNYVDVWSKKPKSQRDMMDYIGELALAKELGMRPMECREFYLAPKSRERKGGRR